jgi:organic hydroperoxide reductase OsmC/OhrA
MATCHTGRPVATNTYETRVHWTGSTGAGWEHYDRTHVGTAPPAEQEVRITTGESKGDPAILNPEQLVLMAASSCQMLWFLHLAAKARIDVLEYEDSATALMPTDQKPVRITEITLRPRIVVSGETSEERVRKLSATAHEHCFVANSLNSQMTLQPTVEVTT